MPSKNPNNHATRFQPGNPGGPGRAKNWLKAAEYKDYVARYCRMTLKDLAAIKHNDTSSVIEVILAGVLLKIAEEPDPSKLEYVLNRTLGRVVDDMRVDNEDGNPIVRIVKADGSVLEVRPPEPKQVDAPA